MDNINQGTQLKPARGSVARSSGETIRNDRMRYFDPDEYANSFYDPDLCTAPEEILDLEAEGYDEPSDFRHSAERTPRVARKLRFF